MPAKANFAISITATVSGLVKGFARAKRFVADFAKQVGAFAKRMGKMGAVVATVALTGLAVLTRQAMQSIDAISKLSDRIGVATEDVAGLGNAAELTGVGADTLNAGLERFVRRVGDATRGSGEAHDALALLGFDAKELASMDTIEAFKQVRDAISELPNAAQRSQIAMAIFSDAGLRMRNVLDLDAEAFAALMNEAEALGITFDRVAGAKVEAANDNITRLWAIAKGVGNALAVELAPFITDVTNRIVKWATESGGVGKVVKNAFQVVLHSLARLADWFELVKAGWHSLKAAATLVLGGIAELVDLVTRGVNWLAKALGSDVVEGAAEFTKAWKDALGETLQEELDAVDMAMSKFLNREHSTKIEEVFVGIQEEAHEAAVAVAEVAAELNQQGKARDFEKEIADIRKKPEARRAAALTIGAGVGSQRVHAVAGAAFGNRPVTVDGMDRLVRETEKQTQAIEDLGSDNGSGVARFG